MTKKRDDLNTIRLIIDQLMYLDRQPGQRQSLQWIRLRNRLGQAENEFEARYGETWEEAADQDLEADREAIGRRGAIGPAGPAAIGQGLKPPRRPPGTSFAVVLALSAGAGAALAVAAGLPGLWTLGLFVVLTVVTFLVVAGLFVDTVRLGRYRIRIHFGSPGHSRVVPRSRTIPQDVKVKVAVRDRGRCRQCGSTQNLHYDHIIPFSKGGRSDTPNNIQLLCGRCNQRKGNRY